MLPLHYTPVLTLDDHVTAELNRLYKPLLGQRLGIEPTLQGCESRGPLYH